MGSCIICGASVDGRICSSHEEDVLFEFRGDHPNQLTPGRFYRGTVDGFAEFGVFVDIGDRVTGLLHRSELDRRLDSLDWDPGDVVYVKVQSIQDNGNVDLGWSIRQDEHEFRGTLVDDPSFDHAKVKSELDEDGDTDVDAEGEAGNAHSGSGAPAGSDATATDDEASTPTVSTPTPEGGRGSPARSADAGEESASGSSGSSDAGSVGASSATDTADAGTTTANGGGGVVATGPREPTQMTVEELPDNVGEFVRLEGAISDVHQTSGPTVFTLRDEEGAIECAAFVEAGVRAYPEVDEGDVVRLDGEVEERRGELQVETEALDVLDAEDREAVEGRMEEALEERARPDDAEPLAEDEIVDGLGSEIVEAATAIRKAVMTDRPVIVRHAATADGYVAGAAIERATLPLVDEAHTGGDAAYHYFDRRPLEGGVYDMEDATKDVTGMLENRERHGEKLPLFVFVGAGGTQESADGFELLSVYGAPRVVVDDVAAEDAVQEAVETIVSPALLEGSEDGEGATATTLAANVAAHVGDVRADLVHLPAVSFWTETPAAYADAASEAGYDAEDARDLRQAIALAAHYQSYEDKRELVADLLFGDDEDDVTTLAGNVAEQFRSKIEREVETARANVDVESVGDSDIAVLDTDAFTNRFDFPPAALLLDHLWRELANVDALIGVDTDALFVRDGDGLDVHAVAEEIAEAAPEAGVTVRSTRERRLRFLAGERDAVVNATLAALGDRL